MIISHKVERENPIEKFMIAAKMIALLAVVCICCLTFSSFELYCFLRSNIMTFYSGKPPWNWESLDISTISFVAFSRLSDEVLISISISVLDTSLIDQSIYDSNSPSLTYLISIRSSNDNRFKNYVSSSWRLSYCIKAFISLHA